MEVVGFVGVYVGLCLFGFWVLDWMWWFGGCVFDDSVGFWFGVDFYNCFLWLVIMWDLFLSFGVGYVLIRCCGILSLYIVFGLVDGLVFCVISLCLVCCLLGLGV